MKRLCTSCGGTITRADLDAGRYVYSRWTNSYYHLLGHCRKRRGRAA